MQNVKTAISIQKSIFEQAEALACKMNISRSRLFGLALEGYIRQQENRELLSKINAACAGDPDQTEQALRRNSKATHRRIVEGEW